MTSRPTPHGLASGGRPASPLGRSSGSAGDSSNFIITTAVSVRERWKKGQEKPEGNGLVPSLVHANDAADLGECKRLLAALLTPEAVVTSPAAKEVVSLE